MIRMVGSYGAGITVRVPRVPDGGETISKSTLEIGHGGKSSNQAVAAARQGAHVEILTSLGNDSFAASARELWTEEGIVHDSCKVGEESTMAGVIIVEPSGENRIAIAPGALEELSPSDIESARELIESSDVVVVCLEIPVATVERTIELSKELGKTVILNPAPANKMSHEIIALADYFIPNQTEHRFYSEDGYVAPADQVQILTRGENGSTIVSGGTETFITPLNQETVIDTTGAGDTFVGTFAACISTGMDLTEAVQRATIASSLSVTKEEVIPSIPRKEAVDTAFSQYLENK